MYTIFDGFEGAITVFIDGGLVDKVQKLISLNLFLVQMNFILVEGTVFGIVEEDGFRRKTKRFLEFGEVSKFHLVGKVVGG